MITNNSFSNNFRAVRIDGGNQTGNTTVDASVVGNTLLDNFRGIIVLGARKGTGSLFRFIIGATQSPICSAVATPMTTTLTERTCLA